MAFLEIENVMNKTKKLPYLADITTTIRKKTMFKRLFIFFSILFSLQTIHAQEDPGTFVEEFFNAFHQRDSLFLKQSFVPDAQMWRVGIKQGKPMLRSTEIMAFIHAVSRRPASPVWEERLGTPISQQHQNMATVWIPFRFYLDNRLSHCGYNVFQLFHDGAQWKIISLSDTATQDCAAIAVD